MNLEDLESFVYNSEGNELENYNKALKDINLYSLDDKDLKKIISKLRSLISNSETPSLKFKFIDYAFITGFIVLLTSFIIYKYIFLLPFIAYHCYVLYKEYYKPIMKNIVEKKKIEINIQEALNNISNLSNVLESRQNIPINIEYKEVTRENVEVVDINSVIQDIESKMKSLSEALLLDYYKRYTDAIVKYYSGEGKHELIDLNKELNEFINNNKNDESLDNNFARKRKINNDKNV